ncbi:MAG: type II toxin-antitoxin system prevent-host-death family antitoxin [Candidatus Schekmanbacteria bacterium]|nr:type II toxin-antitoxin system prevent-host-death family antitoxin [Candidatus Schekmanbacteria bacterium]
MATSVGTFEAKTHLAKLLERVEAGERFVVTHHGREVAVLAPCQRPANPEETIRQIRALRRGMRLAGLDPRELIEEGRRY